MPPTGAIVEVRFKVEPVHKGPLLPAVGVAGGFGSDKEKGPFSFEGHPIKLTFTLV